MRPRGSHSYRLRYAAYDKLAIDIGAIVTEKIESGLAEVNTSKVQDFERRELLNRVLKELVKYYGREEEKPVFIRSECLNGQCQETKENWFRRFFR